MSMGSSARVAARHQASYSDPLVVRSGESVTVTDRESEWEGWLWCLNSHGQGGWLPVDILRRESGNYVATEDFSTAELTVRPGEDVVLHQYRAGWVWVGNRAGESGWVPSSCLGEVDPEA